MDAQDKRKLPDETEKNVMAAVMEMKEIKDGVITFHCVEESFCASVCDRRTQ